MVDNAEMAGVYGKVFLVLAHDRGFRVDAPVVDCCDLIEGDTNYLDVSLFSDLIVRGKCKRVRRMQAVDCD